MALISQTALIPEADAFDFIAAPAVKKQELGPGKEFVLKTVGTTKHIVIKADYKAEWFIGTAGNDAITSKDQNIKTIVGGGGHDIIDSSNNATSQTLYGDNVQAGFTIGSTFGPNGNDALHIGADDIGKSGAGKDWYILHGPFQSGPAKLYANLLHDMVLMGTDPHVTAFEVSRYSADKSAVLLKSFTLTADDDTFGFNMARFINPEVERGKALEGDALDMWVSTGADKKISLAEVEKAVVSWEAKHDFLVHDFDVLL